MQILKMIVRKKCTKKEKMMAKQEIILDIYGQRRGTSSEYYLAESSVIQLIAAKMGKLL